MDIVFRSRNGEESVSIQNGETIAKAAGEAFIPLYGPCGGTGECRQCCRRILEGVENVRHKITGAQPAASPDGTVCAKTCQYVVMGDGVVIQKESRSEESTVDL